MTKDMKLEQIFEITRIRQETKEMDQPRFRIEGVEDAIAFFQREIASFDREVFAVAVLNVKSDIIAFHIAHIGEISSTIVHPREIFKTAILNNGARIIISHNHPSQDCTPSMEDLNVTSRLARSGKLLGIEVLDHIIVSEVNSHSIREYNEELFSV